MPASGEKFTSIVKGSPLWPEHDVEFFSYTEITTPCGGVVTLRSVEDFPCDGMRYVSFFEFPNMITQACPFIFFMFHVRCV